MKTGHRNTGRAANSSFWGPELQSVLLQYCFDGLANGRSEWSRSLENQLLYDPISGVLRHGHGLMIFT